MFDDKDVTNLKTESRNIAQVFQFPVIYNTMTVYENLAFPLKCRDFSQSKIDERVKSVADTLNLQSFFAIHLQENLQLIKNNLYLLEEDWSERMSLQF